MPTSIVLSYDSILAASYVITELIFCIPFSELFVCALFSFLLAALVGGPTGFTSVFTAFENIGPWEVLSPLPEAVHNFLQSVKVFQITSERTVNLEKVYIA